MNAICLLIMVVKWVFFQILTNATMAPLGNFKKFKVKVYTVAITHFFIFFIQYSRFVYQIKAIN